MYINSFPPIRQAIRLALLLLFTAVNTMLFSQLQDFNHFQTLTAKGTIPADFTTITSTKIEEDIATRRTNLSPAKEKIFLEGIHYSIDQILHSGNVIYGDEITQYIQSVAANLLRNEPELLGKLRFYTIKSNETNALSTDQGIVFVTTGLISQLTSEAQLAYILSHEIAHYTEKHVAETFNWKIDNQYASNRIERLSSYSKEHEFAADKLALKLYHGAGYSKFEIISAFDVLMYSYLPFDEVDFPNSYFQSSQVYIPDNCFADKKYPIKAEEDYNDSRSSHPNIKKRKDAVLDALDDYSGWGTIVYSQGESNFKYVRNLARFESVRTDIIDREFAHAMYSIFLLEQSFPESVYLKRMKALSWLGLAQFKEKGKQNDVIPNTSEFEGESAGMYYFLRKQNNEATLTLALRQVYDIAKAYPEDSMLAGIKDRLVKTLAESDHFSWERYSRFNFYESAKINNFKKELIQPLTVDKITVQTTSKYDKIKSKKNLDASESFDSSRYYLFAIPDILNDTVLIGSYNYYKRAYDKAEKEREAYREMSRKERHEYDKTLKKKKKNQNPIAIGLSNCIVVQPGVEDYKRKQINLKSSEQLEQNLSEIIAEESVNTGIEVALVDHNNLSTNGTVGFNERSVLYSLLEQTAHYDGIEGFPVDFDALQTIRLNYGTSDILYTSVEHYYDPNISWELVGVSALLFPTLPVTILVYFPIQLIRGHHLKISLLVINAETGKVKAVHQSETRTNARKHYLADQFYHLLNLLKQTPEL